MDYRYYSEFNPEYNSKPNSSRYRLHKKINRISINLICFASYGLMAFIAATIGYHSTQPDGIASALSNDIVIYTTAAFVGALLLPFICICINSVVYRYI